MRAILLSLKCRALLCFVFAAACQPEPPRALVADAPKAVASAPIPTVSIAPPAPVASFVDAGSDAHEPPPEEKVVDGEEQSGDGLGRVRSRFASTMYHRRLLAYFQTGFSCPTAGGTPCASVIVYAIAPDGTVDSFAQTPCGRGAIDALAKGHATGKVGGQVPPAPLAYPDVQRREVRVSYTCR